MVKELVIKGNQTTITIKTDVDFHNEESLAKLGLEMCKAYMTPIQFLTDLCKALEQENLAGVM